MPVSPVGFSEHAALRGRELDRYLYCRINLWNFPLISPSLLSLISESFFFTVNGIVPVEFVRWPRSHGPFRCAWRRPRFAAQRSAAGRNFG